MQGELTERWEKTPPSAAEIIGEIADTSAPAEHRVYIAHSFRNLAKMNRLEVKEAVNVLEQMLEVVGETTEDPLVRGQLAVVVSGFDKSPEAVRAIAPLLNDKNDDAGALAVTALRHTAKDEAATALYEYLQRDKANRDAKPKTTASALLALTGYGKLDLVPITKEIVTQTQSLELFQAALLSLSKAKSSVAVLDAILAAYDQKTGIKGLEPERIRAASLRAIGNHFQFIEGAKETLENSIVLQRAKSLILESKNVER